MAPTTHRRRIGFHELAERLHPRCQAETLEAPRHLLQRRPQASGYDNRRCAPSLHGVACLSWIRHPEPIGLRQATPSPFSTENGTPPAQQAGTSDDQRATTQRSQEKTLTGRGAAAGAERGDASSARAAALRRQQRASGAATPAGRSAGPNHCVAFWPLSTSSSAVRMVPARLRQSFSAASRARRARCVGSPRSASARSTAAAKPDTSLAISVAG